MTGTKRRRYSAQHVGDNGGGGGGGGSSSRSGCAGAGLGESATTTSVGSDGTSKAKKRFVWPDDLHRWVRFVARGLGCGVSGVRSWFVVGWRVVGLIEPSSRRSCVVHSFWDRFTHAQKRLHTPTTNSNDTDPPPAAHPRAHATNPQGLRGGHLRRGPQVRLAQDDPRDDDQHQGPNAGAFLLGVHSLN